MWEGMLEWLWNNWINQLGDECSMFSKVGQFPCPIPNYSIEQNQ